MLNTPRILIKILLLTLTSTLAAPLAADEPYSFRSMVFVKPENCTADMLRQGKEFGYNDVQLTTERGAQDRKIIAANKHFEENGLYEVCDELDMTVSLWVHEWFEEQWNPAWGDKPSVDNPAIWEELRERYTGYMTEMIPKVSTYILTFAETHITARTLDVKWKVINTINEVCREHGNKLVVRTFRGGPGWVDDLQGIPEDVILQYKIVPWDWNMRGIINPLVGFADAFGDYTEFVEYDTGGEYWRFDMLANCWTDTLEERFDVQEQADITGISVRVDRGGNNVLNHPNAVNIMYLGLRSSGDYDEDEVWNAFVREHYGEGLEEEIKEILYPTGQVNAEALCIGHAQFGSGRSGTPGSWRYKNPAANPLSWRLSMRMQWGMMEAGILEDSPMMREWFMAQEGHDLIIAKEKDAYATQLASAETSLAKLQPLKDRLEPGAFELLDWLLTENILHLKAMQELQLAWLYAKRAQHTEGSEESQEFIDRMEHHIANFHALEDEYEIGKKPEITWREREHTVPRGAWMNWDRMRERWFPNLREVANSAPDKEYPTQVGDSQGFPDNFPRDIPVIKHFQKQAGNDNVSSSRN